MRRFSRRDADNYERYVHAVMRQCRFIRPLLLRTPPDPVALRPRDMGELLFLGRRFHDVGQHEMGEAIRFWTMSIGDFLDQFVQFRPDLPHGQGAAGGCQSPQVFADPEYDGKISIGASVDDADALASLAIGVTDWTTMTDEQLQEASPLPCA